MEFKEQLEELVDLIERWTDGEETVISEIEATTSDLIAEDNFNSLPDEIQNEIYYFDMHEIENPLIEDFFRARKILKKYLKTL